MDIATRIKHEICGHCIYQYTCQIDLEGSFCEYKEDKGWVRLPNNLSFILQYFTTIPCYIIYFLVGLITLSHGQKILTLPEYKKRTLEYDGIENKVWIKRR